VTVYYTVTAVESDFREAGCPGAIFVTGVTTASSGTASSGTSARHSSDSRV